MTTSITPLRAFAIASFVCAAATLPHHAAAAALPAYTPAGTYDLPANTAAYDILPDGRAIAIVGDSIFTQSALNSSSFTLLGSLPTGTVASFGASFLRVSPDGSRLAVGDNVFGPAASVYTLDLSSLDPSAPSAATRWELANADATWADDSTLFVTGFASTAQVARISLTDATTRVVISNIDGATGGVATDSTYLYTANGFDFAPTGSATGEVRAFRLTDIASLAPSASLDFEALGIPVADALSGASLGFDALGNLLIGGGDAFGSPPDAGYAAVVDAAAVASALAGGPIAPDASELRLTPRSSSDSYYTRFNRATGELLVTYYDNSTFSAGTTVYRYAIPAPGMVIMSGAFLAFAARRRRA